MPTVDPYRKEETKFRREFLLAALSISLLLAVILIAFPEIDLSISGAMRFACQGPGASGGWCSAWFIDLLRNFFIAIFVIAAAVSLVASARTFLVSGSIFGLAQARCWFLIATFVMGPGVVANVVFKDNWGRARPRDVVEFGGTKIFTPPLLPARECRKNCAFVSGEASSIYAPFFALAFLVPQYRLALLVGGIAAGTLAGVVRISQGAHFLSDIVFAGLFMALTVSIIHILLIGIWRDPRLWLGPLAVRPLYEAPRIGRGSQLETVAELE